MSRHLTLINVATAVGTIMLALAVYKYVVAEKQDDKSED